MKNFILTQKEKLAAMPKKKIYICVGVLLLLVIVGTKTFGAINQRQKENHQQELISDRRTNLDQSKETSPNTDTPEETKVADEPSVTTTNTPTNSNANKPSNNSSVTSNGSNSSSTGTSSSSGSSGTNTNSGTASVPSCGNNYSFFDHAPTVMSEFANIAPLGNLNPSGHVFPTDHIYFYHQTNSTSTIYAPGNVTVTRISASQNQTAGITDYSIYFKPCSELEVYYLHISTMSQKLLDAFVAPFSWDSTYSTGGSTYRNYGRNVNVSLSSGDVMGTFTGQYAFDMGAYDSRVTLNFINANARPNSIHTVCPLDYYSGDLKTTLYSYLGSSAYNKRTIPPLCGTIDQDVANTAQGVWLLKGTAKVNGEDSHLALVHNNVNPAQAVFSVGTSVSGSGLSTGVYVFTPTDGSYNKDFSSVTVESGPQCYRTERNGAQTILIQLTSATTLKIEKLTGDCDSPRSFTGNETEFQR